MSEETWDVDKYKTEHECDEHWELRRKFMLAHQHTLPEDELVCMAQVFTNIEFLGCRYPNETMIRVAELAKGVVEDFREKKKDTLKRTFVAASDAASSKVKGLNRNRTSSEEGSAAKKPMKFIPPSRVLKPSSGPLGKFVVLLQPNKSSQALLDQSLAANRVQLQKEINLLPSGLTECISSIDGTEFCRVTAENSKSAKQLAATAALEKLTQQCYSILVKDTFVGQAVEQSDVGIEPVRPASNQSLGESNVGSKLMKLMGWTGGGLGSKAQGRVEPVEGTSIVRRAGLGLEPTTDYRGFRRKITQYLEDWLAAGANPDLVFSTDFDKEHRKIVHQVANKFGLKSHSYGNENNRRLVISKKISLWNLVEELAVSDGESGKYKLLDPGTPWQRV